jgi:hypothetical protein
MFAQPSGSAPVVITGAGAGGMAAALAAVVRGQEVMLLDTTEYCGGTVRQALIHTLGGFYDSEGSLLNEGLSAELLSRLEAASPSTVKRRMGRVWVLNVDPAVYTQVLRTWLQTFDKLHFLPRSRIIGLGLEQAAAHEPSINNVLIKTPDGETLQPVSAVIDATGQCTVVRQWREAAVIEGAALAGFIIQLRGVEAGVLRFPHSVTLLQRIRKAVSDGRLPVECSTVWLDSGVLPDEAYAKFNLSVAAWDAQRMHDAAQALMQFLNQQQGFSVAYINHYGELGIRDGGQIAGRYLLTETDIKQGNSFADIAGYGCWPIEHWDVSKGIELEYFPAGHRYAIPLRSLQLEGIRNLWVAGKCLSAEPRVRASTRVVGTCWAMGEAVGTHLAKGVKP